MKLSKNFVSTEFSSPDNKASGLMMNKEFIKRLQIARDLAGIPFHINSGFRTPEHNAKVGGQPNSAHLRGFACDIATSSPNSKFIILKSLLNAGFLRIGVYETFIHCDTDPSLPIGVIWTK
jgi:uncharacterized protein YcbK (DUF882 family)